MAAQRFNAWCFTNYKLDNDFQKVIDDGKCEYICYGDEVCPTTQRKHQQGWAWFKNRKTNKKEVATLLGVSHVEGCKGSLSQNDVYCSKEGEMKHFGKRPTPGERLDLQAIKQRIIDGASVDELTMENPEMFHQYGRTLSKIEMIALRKQHRTWMTIGKWFYGRTGTGTNLNKINKKTAPTVCCWGGNPHARHTQMRLGCVRQRYAKLLSVDIV